MKRVFGALAVVVVCVIGYMVFAPMGTGSESRMLRFKKSLEIKGNEELQGSVNGFVVLKFSDGELRSICDDSHASPWGGNMIMADGKQVVWSRMGHVCGSSYLVSSRKRYIDECAKGKNIDSKQGFIDWMNLRVR